MKKAFTLIELLVVIAIIAILAAILFPVFAQAKEAAKRTAMLSGVKQTATAAQLYLGDSDDVYPMACVYYRGGWYPSSAFPTPFDWRPGRPADYAPSMQVGWANSMQPYLKGFDLLAMPGATDIKLLDTDDFSVALRKIAKTNLQMNGLLNTYNASGIAAPAQLPVFTQSNGKVNLLGYASSNPALACDHGDQPCRYVAPAPGCENSAQNGAVSGFSYPVVTTNGANPRTAPMTTFGRGQVWAFADGHAKLQKVGMNVDGRTDYRTDPWSQYHPDGSIRSEWQDTDFCHSLLFMPDFDFQNFGTPVEWRRDDQVE